MQNLEVMDVIWYRMWLAQIVFYQVILLVIPVYISPTMDYPSHSDLTF